MAKHRTAAELAAEAEERAASLRLKAARKELADHPEVVAIDRQIATLQASNIKYDRWLREADEKIANFENRANDWRNKKAEAEEMSGNAKTEIAALREQKDIVISGLLNQNMEQEA